MKRSISAACLAAAAFLFSGCIGHYRITDPESGDTYYTREWQMEGDPKTQARFIDARTEKVHLIDKPKIESINGKDYEAAVGK